MENSLINVERSLAEDILLINSECEFNLNQLEELKNQITQVTNEISIAEVCNVSENSKIDSHLSAINSHKQGFDDLFAKERKIYELRNKELKQKEAELEEIGKQRIAKMLEANDQKGFDAAAIESECDAIERECTVLTKRNKAIFIKLRRKLLEAEGTRRDLMKEIESSNNM